ncbi:MAG: hypothetical protein M1838_003689 [Thelocarpon superellum]|nr:MAG: hypothetical protein M1838_003689 [Thelocarpon superellum]
MANSNDASCSLTFHDFGHHFSDPADVEILIGTKKEGTISVSSTGFRVHAQILLHSRLSQYLDGKCWPEQPECRGEPDVKFRFFLISGQETFTVGRTEAFDRWTGGSCNAENGDVPSDLTKYHQGFHQLLLHIYKTPPQFNLVSWIWSLNLAVALGLVCQAQTSLEQSLEESHRAIVPEVYEHLLSTLQSTCELHSHPAFREHLAFSSLSQDWDFNGIRDVRHHRPTSSASASDGSPVSFALRHNASTTLQGQDGEQKKKLDVPGMLHATDQGSEGSSMELTSVQDASIILSHYPGSRDSNRTQVHLNQPRVADIFEDFCRDKLPDDEIYVPPHHQPINPEDEDDVVPDQHAAFGITRATQKTREAAWKDLGLEELMARKPDAKSARGPKLPR